MASVAWIRLTKFGMPWRYRAMCRLSGILTRGGVRASYERSKNAVLIQVQFDEAHVERVLRQFSGLLRKWGEQKRIQA